MTFGDQKSPKKFPLIQVSEPTHSLIRALENVSVALGNVKTDRPGWREETEHLYSKLCMVRKRLYERIEEIEKRANIERTIKLRFD